MNRPTTEEIIGIIEVGLKPQAAFSQRALHVLVLRLEHAEGTVARLARAYMGYLEHCKNSNYDSDFMDYVQEFYSPLEFERWGKDAVIGAGGIDNG